MKSSASNALPANSPSNVPLWQRQSELFARLVNIERGESMPERVLGHFLRVERPSRHGTSLGLLRCALAWHALPEFLDREGWTVEGSFGVHPRRGELGISTFQMVALGDSIHLEAPVDLCLFLSRGSGRAVLQFEREHTVGGARIEIKMSSSEPHSTLFERWYEAVRAANPLRGRSLLPNGRVVERRGLRDGEMLFVAPETRRRIDFAARRFLSQDAARLPRLGVRHRSGLILAGPPGTGKSSLCRELSGTLDCTFLWVTPGDFLNLEDVSEIYELARWLAPTVVVLEDLDMIAESRERGNQSRLLGELMNQLDGIGGDHRVLTIATTNRLEVVEEAVRNRPGRFDQVIEIEPPDAKLRLELLKHRFRQCDVEEADIAYLASRLEGATGAELEEVANLVIATAVFGAGQVVERPSVGRGQFSVALSDLRRRPERCIAGFGSEKGSNPGLSN